MRNAIAFLAAWATVVVIHAEENGLDMSNGSGGGLILAPGQPPSLSGSLEDTTEEFNKVLDRWMMIGGAALAVLTLALLGVLIVNIAMFVKSADNERDRGNAKSRIMYSIIAIALMGALDLITVLCRNLFA